MLPSAPIFANGAQLGSVIALPAPGVGISIDWGAWLGAGGKIGTASVGTVIGIVGGVIWPNNGIISEEEEQRQLEAARGALTLPSILNAESDAGNDAKAPGKPGADDGFEEGKDGGPLVQNPNGNGKGYRDRKGDVWVPTGPSPGKAHGGPHWDVQTPGGGHRNVYPGGRVR